MTSDACREQRGALAAAAIGRIDPAEEIALAAHLDGCAECRAELQELERVSAVLPFADVARVTAAPPEPSAQLAGRVLQRVAAERLRARRRFAVRVGTIAAAIVAVAVIAGTIAATRGDDGDRGTRVVFAPVAGVRGEAMLEARGSGTEVHLDAAGFGPQAVYWLWLTDDDGDRVSAGTFRGDADRDVDVRLTAALSLDDARRIWVTDEEDHVLLDAHLPPV